MNHLNTKTLARIKGWFLLWSWIVLGLLITSLGGCAFSSSGLSNDCVPCYAGAPLGRVDEILVNTGFTIGYSDAREDPLWVCYKVFAVSTPISHPRPSTFKVDLRTVAEVSYQDYAHSGYDRGHMAPTATIDYCYGRDAQLETFYMSNVCPQSPTLNRGIWAKLESTVRDWANTFGEVWVFTGPIFDDVIKTLPSGVEIPDAFYKIVVDEDNGLPRVLSFVIPQNVPAGTQLTSWLTSVDEIERQTGFDFLSNLSDDIENTVESTIPTELWTTTAQECGPEPLPEPSPGEGKTSLPLINVQITRIFYDGTVPRVESDEYVEITNLGDSAQDLFGWKLKDISDGYPEFTFPHYVLLPHKAIRVYTNEIHPEWGGFSFHYGKAVWHNKDPDTAVLYNSQGQEVSRKSY